MPAKPTCLIACSILQDEVEHILHQLGKSGKVHIQWLPPALHANLNNLKAALTEALAHVHSAEEEKSVLLYGSRCHPEIDELCHASNVRGFTPPDCIGLLLGDRRLQFDKEANTFYLTPGWLHHWKEIFMQGLGWDSIDARQNFGIYDRILLLDPGLSPIDEELILEFFEYTQVPVEILPVGLEYLTGLLVGALLDE